MDERWGLPAWAMSLIAVVGPLLLGLGFVTAMGAIHEPLPVAEANRRMQEIAQESDALVVVLGGCLAGFVLLGASILPRTTLGRVLFLVISIPWAGLMFVVSVMSQVAK